MTRSRGSLSIVVVLLLIVAAWQGYIWLSHVPSYVLPSPLQTARAIGGNLSPLLHGAVVTSEGAVFGLTASIVLATALALTIVRWPYAKHAILTYSLLVRTLPIVGVVPIVTLLTGRGLATSVLCVIVITVFALLVAITQGFESVPVEINELGDLYATPFRRRLRVTLLPAAAASLLLGLRVAAPLAVLGALLAEWLDGFNGVGELMITANADQEVQLLMAACVTAVALSLGAFAMVELATVLAARRGFLVDNLGVGSQ
jgi:ABC-type nitrate/sulfonate/bicarbonate transport system permease component